MKNDSFVDEVSKRVYNQLPNQSSVVSHVMLNIEQFEMVAAMLQLKYKIDMERT
jgi:hypothetical protein